MSNYLKHVSEAYGLMAGTVWRLGTFTTVAGYRLPWFDKLSVAAQE
ncbi:hypothetical protein A6C57_25795 [Fibrella sp. ES10-3-2-2]